MCKASSGLPAVFSKCFVNMARSAWGSIRWSLMAVSILIGCGAETKVSGFQPSLARPKDQVFADDLLPYPGEDLLIVRAQEPAFQSAVTESYMSQLACVFELVIPFDFDAGQTMGLP